MHNSTAFVWRVRKGTTVSRENRSAVSMEWKEVFTLKGQKGNCWDAGPVLGLDWGGGQSPIGDYRCFQ